MLKTRNESDRIALRGVRLTSRLAGMSQKTTIEQTYVNQEEHDIEAVYTFPLPDGAAVCGFQVVTDDRVVSSRIVEAEEAAEQYEKALEQGHGGFLLEENRPDIFTVLVGNLKPRQLVTIRLTYVRELDLVDRCIRVAFPTTVAPRYIPSTGQDPAFSLTDGEMVNPPHVLHVPYGLSMQVDLSLGRPVRSVRSPSHAIQVSSPSEQESRVTLDGGITQMDRDIVLEIGLHADAAPHAQVDRRDQEAFAAVTFVPQFEADDLAETGPSEVVFLLDCSGSMDGESIEHARRALELCLRQLREDDLFNICRFGSTFEFMSPKPLVYGEKTLHKTIHFLKRINADLGGTELHQPLEAILAMPSASGKPREIILITDGEVSNEDTIIRMAGRYRAGNRVFTFGIGAAPSTYLLRGLARVTHGEAEFVAYGEDIASKVLRAFGRMASPSVEEVCIDWGDAQVEQSPAQAGPLFDGDVLRVYGRITGRVPQQVVLRCRTAAGPRSWPVQLNEVEAGAGMLPALWARAAIQDLEDALETKRPGRPARRNKTLHNSLVRLSCDFGLLCRLTSFLAIEERTDGQKSTGRAEVRFVPTQLADGWGGVQGHWFGRMAGMPMSPCPSMPAPPAVFRELADFTPADEATDACSLPPSGPQDDLLEMLALQTADGSFEGGTRLGSILQLGDAQLAACRDTIAKVLDSFGGIRGDRERIIGTVLALAAIRRWFPERRDVWVRASRKACRYLAKHLGLDMSVLEDVLDQAASVLPEDRPTP
jgi:Ca-activated chloride channel family protein